MSTESPNRRKAETAFGRGELDHSAVVQPQQTPTDPQWSGGAPTGGKVPRIVISADPRRPRRRPNQSATLRATAG